MTWGIYANPDGTDCDFGFPTKIPLTYDAGLNAWISECYPNILNQCFAAFLLECDPVANKWTLFVFASEIGVTAATVNCDPFQLTFSTLPVTGVRNTDCVVHGQSIFCCGSAFFTNITITD